MKKITFLFILLLAFNCKQDSKNDINVSFTDVKPAYYLDLVPSSHTNISFSNTVKETYKENYLNYEFLYNGSGVAIGDLNNDNLPDIYFGGNSSDDKLYINEGNLKFKDISESLGIHNLKGWSTGVTMVDINADGLLDIYVCRSGPSNISKERANKLFINQGNLKFVESAKLYNLDKTTHSIQSAFFDYDLDGDLDMYLLNHPEKSFKAKDFFTHVNDVNTGQLQTDFFFENIDGKYTDKTREAGLVNFGFRHGIAIGDVNQDNYPDLYISSDFDEPDLLYINTKNKSFKNQANEKLKHMSYNSMGNEFADINNDGLLDIYVVDMAPNNHYRSKVFMASMNTDKFHAMANNNFHYQYMQNTLHLNRNTESFSEIAQSSGLAKSDWSWAPLFFDINLDGQKDLFISNGIKENFLFRDIQTEINKKQKELNRNLKIEELLELVPSDITPNNLYQNNGSLKFTEVSESWISDQNFNSNGAAYGDLDNDGDLELVLNNMESEAAIYKNNATEMSDNNFLKIKLIGSIKNRFALGSKITVQSENMMQVQELQNTRGYLSSMDHVLVFGLKNTAQKLEVKVNWPDGRITKITNVQPNQTLTLVQNDAKLNGEIVVLPKTLLTAIDLKNLNINYTHKENQFNDFSKQLLLPQKQSTLGPCLAVADINGDDLDDFFVGGAFGQEGQLYVQSKTGTFNAVRINAFNEDKIHEDVGALFFDADNDGDLDLYVASGGYEIDENHALFQDRLYINEGNSRFIKSNNLPTMLSSTKAVKSFDYDKDGDLDIIVGGRVIPGKYPLAPRSFILENNDGIFTDVTNDIAPDFSHIGMISDIEITDVNGDGNLDFIVVGQWMPITLFSFEDGKFVKLVIVEFKKTEGWYFSIASADFDKDGDMDYVIGNIGSNNKFHPTLDKPLHIFSNDFDKNGSYDIALSKTYNGELVPTRGKECSSEQTPFLNEKVKTFQEFATLNINGIYGDENINNANHLMAYNFESIYVENKGNDNFEIHKLPMVAQFGPTQDMIIDDINNDGHLDILGVGNLFDTEVETVRFDASQGYILLGNSNGKFEPALQSGLHKNSDMRAVSKINIQGQSHIIVVNNNDIPAVYRSN